MPLIIFLWSAKLCCIPFTGNRWVSPRGIYGLTGHFETWSTSDIKKPQDNFVKGIAFLIQITEITIIGLHNLSFHFKLKMTYGSVLSMSRQYPNKNYIPNIACPPQQKYEALIAIIFASTVAHPCYLDKYINLMSIKKSD